MSMSMSMSVVVAIGGKETVVDKAADAASRDSTDYFSHHADDDQYHSMNCKLLLLLLPYYGSWMDGRQLKCGWVPLYCG